MNGRPSAPLSSDPGARSSVRADGLHLLYRQWASALLLSIMASALWVWIMWDQLDRSGLLVWSGGIAFAVLVRGALFVSFRRRKPQGDQILRWERPFCLTLLIGTTIWGVGTPLLIADAALSIQLISFLFCVGNSGVGISAYGVLPRFTILFVAIMVLPTSLMWLLQGGHMPTTLAACGLFYVVSIARGVSQHASAIYESYQLRQQLQDAYRISDQQANTDALTGIRNRRSFLAACSALLAARTEGGTPSTMLLIDLDDFKRINDAFGHAAGDAALKHVAELLQASCRGSDPCGRLGGDEFALFLHQTPLQHACMVAQELHHAVANQPLLLADRPVVIGISIGLAAHSNELEALMLGADDALYRAKRLGKNQSAVHSVEVVG